VREEVLDLAMVDEIARTGDLVGAAASLRVLLRRYAPHADGLFRLATIERASGQPLAALKNAVKALKLSPQRLDITSFAARCALEVGKGKESLRLYERSIALGAEILDATEGVGRSFLLRNQVEDAWDRVLPIFVKHGSTHSGLHDVLVSSGMLINRTAPVLERLVGAAGSDGVRTPATRETSIEAMTGLSAADLDLISSADDLFESLDEPPDNPSPAPKYTISMGGLRGGDSLQVSPKSEASSLDAGFDSSLDLDDEFASLPLAGNVTEMEDISSTDLLGNSISSETIMKQDFDVGDGLETTSAESLPTRPLPSRPLPMKGSPCGVDLDRLSAALRGHPKPPEIWMWSMAVARVPEGINHLPVRLSSMHSRRIEPALREWCAEVTERDAWLILDLRSSALQPKIPTPISVLGEGLPIRVLYLVDVLPDERWPEWHPSWV